MIGTGKGNEQTQYYDPDRVARKHLCELVRIHKSDEVLQANPLASGETVGGVVVPECDLDTVHWPVLEDHDVEYRAGTSNTYNCQPARSFQLKRKGNFALFR